MVVVVVVVAMSSRLAVLPVASAMAGTTNGSLKLAPLKNFHHFLIQGHMASMTSYDASMYTWTILYH